MSRDDFIMTWVKPAAYPFFSAFFVCPMKIGVGGQGIRQRHHGRHCAGGRGIKDSASNILYKNANKQ